MPERVPHCWDRGSGWQGCSSRQTPTLSIHTHTHTPVHTPLRHPTQVPYRPSHTSSMRFPYMQARPRKHLCIRSYVFHARPTQAHKRPPLSFPIRTLPTPPICTSYSPHNPIRSPVRVSEHPYAPLYAPDTLPHTGPHT